MTSMTDRSVAVFGPAYLDRVLRVDRPLIDPESGPPLDQSVDGVWKFGTNRSIELIDPSGYTLEFVVPDDWPGPTGEIQLSRQLRSGIQGRRTMRGLEWRDDLGGMGAGYAAALCGALYSALGPVSDPTSQAIAGRLARMGVVHHPLRVSDHPADWTLLITSGEFGDKLPIGFRGCHAALGTDSLDLLATQPCDLRVVASLPNALAARVLRAPGARVRLYAPSMRNMLDRECPISSFAAAIDVLCCNRIEWETLDSEEAAWLVSILVVTDGSQGSTVRFTTPSGDSGLLRIPAFPRDRPPRDTNRAGEAFAATLIDSLLNEEWNSALGVVEERVIRSAAERASAAAALVLDRVDFGFPGPAQVDAALRAGRIK
jgi:sugar/nucleoside kinase (ribokinase family)